MKNLLGRLVLAALALCTPLPASAQAAPPGTAVAPAPTTALKYQSAFTDYRPWLDIKPGDWRRLNDDVAPATGKSGVRDGQARASGTDAKASPPQAPAHHGHSMHGRQP